MIRVLLGQRDNLVGGALAAVLSAEQNLRVVAQVDHGDGVLPLAASQRARVAVLHAGLPGAVTVGELCRGLHRELPVCRPLLLVERGQRADLGRSLLPLAPWLGMLATDAAPDDLVDGVCRLARGDRVLDPGLAEQARAAREDPLTERERDILRLTRYGAPTKEIARKLGLSVGTVRNHLSHSLTKTGARTRLEAANIAQDAGWI